MALGDEQIDRLTTNLDAVLKARIEQFQQVGQELLGQFQESMNGINIATNVTMPVVKKADSA